MAEDRWDVFISYARKDGFATARRLHADLTQAGFDVWWDKGGGIPYGSDFTVEIEAGIANSDYLVVLLTPAAVRPDGFVRKEIGYTLQHGKRVIPLMLLDCIPPVQIVNANYIDMRVDYSRALDALIEVCQGGPDDGELWRTDGEPPYRAPFLFVGRRHIIESIEQSMDRLKRGDSAFHLILGEPGFGKTGLLREIHHLADHKGALALFADFAYSGPSAVDHDPVSSVVRSLWAQLVASSEQARHYHKQIDPEHADSPLLWLRDALKQVSCSQPVVLCLDNLHLDTMGVMTAWIRQLVGSPVMIVASRLSDSFTNPPEGARALRTVLSPLQPYELSYLFSPPELDHGRRLFELSGGLPSTVWAILTTWTIHGITEKRPDGFALRDASHLLPDIWSTQIEGRLHHALAQAGLQDEYSFEVALDWLTCAAVEGEVFTGEALKQVMSEDIEPEHTTQLLGQLAGQDNAILALAKPSLPIESTYWRFVPPGLAELLRCEAHPEDVAFCGSRLFDVLEKLAHPYPFGIRHHLARLAKQSLEAEKQNLEQEQGLPPDSVRDGLIQSPILQQLRRYQGYLDREQRISQLRMLISITPEEDYARRWPLMRDLGIAIKGYENKSEVADTFRLAREMAQRAHASAYDLARLYNSEAQVNVPHKALDLLASAWQLLPSPISRQSIDAPLAGVQPDAVYGADLFSIVANIKLTLARVYHESGQPKNAVPVLDESLMLWRSLRNQPGESAALTVMGQVWSDLGERRKALEAYEQVFALQQAIGDLEGQATTLNNIGSLWDQLGEHHTGLTYMARALELEQAIGDRFGVANTLGNMGAAWHELREYQKAVSCLEPALMLKNELGDALGGATTLINLGSTISALGDRQRALELYERGLVIARSIGDRVTESKALGNMGLTWYLLGDDRKALDYCESALRIVRETGDRASEAALLSNLGAIWFSLGDKQQDGIDMV